MSKKRNFILTPGKLTFSDLKLLLDENIIIELHAETKACVQAAQSFVKQALAANETHYGINTGFGALAHTKINAEDLSDLQERIILSHAAGTGELLPDAIVRLMMILKINSLARGFSGVSWQVITLLLKLVNAKIYPCIPSQGSVGASGDLAPLAHLSSILLGVGQARHQEKMLEANAALQLIQAQPISLAPKEGLALINGTQVSTAIALYHLIESEKIFHAAIMTGAMSVEAARASLKPFAACISEVRGHQGQINVAAQFRALLANSAIMASHSNCAKVQDPYSLRCQPQVMGACLEQLRYALTILVTEANAVSDNPLIFIEEGQILSGGNFHAEPVAFAADAIAIALAEISAITERRIALLIDSKFSGLPAFLIPNPGLNSGFMVAHVTASALASENKCLAHPASIDSIPTSANQEDHVSMATYAARRLGNMIDNAYSIIGIECLAASQGIDLLRPLQSSSILERIHKQVREIVPFFDQDRYFAPAIADIKSYLSQGLWQQHIELNLFDQPG